MSGLVSITIVKYVIHAAIFSSVLDSPFGQLHAECVNCVANRACHSNIMRKKSSPLLALLTLCTP